LELILISYWERVNSKGPFRGIICKMLKGFIPTFRKKSQDWAINSFKKEVDWITYQDY